MHPIVCRAGWRQRTIKMLHFSPCLEQSCPCSQQFWGVKAGKALQQRAKGEMEREEMDFPMGFNCAVGSVGLQNPISSHPGARDTWNGPNQSPMPSHQPGRPKWGLIKALTQVYLGTGFLLVSYLQKSNFYDSALPSWAPVGVQPSLAVPVPWSSTCSTFPAPGTESPAGTLCPQLEPPWAAEFQHLFPIKWSHFRGFSFPHWPVLLLLIVWLGSAPWGSEGLRGVWSSAWLWKKLIAAGTAGLGQRGSPKSHLQSSTSSGGPDSSPELHWGPLDGAEPLWGSFKIV